MTDDINSNPVRPFDSNRNAAYIRLQGICKFLDVSGSYFIMCEWITILLGRFVVLVKTLFSRLKHNWARTFKAKITL